jgi:hypothetical protein
MDKLVRQAIVEILKENTQLLRIPIRQRAKFEGWLKFQLAHHLEIRGMAHVEVESRSGFGRYRNDVTFFSGGEPYSVELKTPTANWQLGGVSLARRHLTEGIQAVIEDAEKLNSPSGIVAFVLFPVPVGDDRWQAYLYRINEKTQLRLTREENCELINIPLEEGNACTMVVCTFRSRRFRSWT